MERRVCALREPAELVDGLGKVVLCGQQVRARALDRLGEAETGERREALLVRGEALRDEVARRLADLPPPTSRWVPDTQITGG